MSRIGKLPVVVPGGVTATVSGQEVKVKGPKGELAVTLVDDVSASLAEGKITLTPRDETKRSRSMWGMQRTLVQNMVTGVTQGYSKTLEITGVGFKAAAKGPELLLNLGFSHDVNFPVPQGIEIKTPKPTEIVISGIDKQQVGQVAAEIRSWREPEPYKGKGIKYSTETVFRKEGKKK